MLYAICPKDNKSAFRREVTNNPRDTKKNLHFSMFFAIFAAVAVSTGRDSAATVLP